MAKIQKISERVYCGVYFALILDTRHPSKDGKYPVAVRITHDYRQTYIVVGMRMTEAEYERVAKAGKGELFRRRKDCEEVFDSVFAQAKRMIDSGDFNFKALRGKVTGKTGDTLASIFDQKIEMARRDDKHNTARLYETVKRKIGEYFGDVRMTDVGVNLALEFRKRMEMDGISRTTQGIYLRHLRSVCNMALYDEKISESQYPFRRSAGDSRRMRMITGAARTDWYLSIEDMRRIYEYECDGEDRVNVGLFLFSYLANGMNMADMAHLKYDDNYFITGRKMLTFVRRKTVDTGDAKPIRIPVTDWLRNVIDRMETDERVGGYVLPFILNSKDGRTAINELWEWGKRVSGTMRRVCGELGINGKVSMTWARHSFKTNLIRLRVPDHYCEQAMGHAERSVGAYYVAPFTLEDMMTYNSMLL